MKSSNLALALLAAAALLFAACAIPTGGQTPAGTAYTITAAPKVIGVNVPSSLVASSTAGKALDSARGFGSGSWFSSENRGAHHWIKDTMWQTEKSLTRAAARMVLLDSVITANSLQPGTVAAQTHQDATKAHVWTQAEVDAVKALLPAAFTSNSAFAKEAKLPAAGDSIDLPAFDYYAVDKTGDTVNAAYDVEVVFSSEQSEDDSASTIAVTRSYYWTTDKSQFKFAIEKSDSATSPATVLELQFVAYDSTTGTMAAGRQARQGSMSLQVKSDPASTTNGVFIDFSATIEPRNTDEYKSDASIGSGSSLTFSASGYADSAGGTVSETLVVSPATGSALTLYFKESFDGAGKLTLVQATDSSGAPLASQSGTIGAGINQANATDHYSDKMSGVAAAKTEMEASRPAEALKLEVRHHATESVQSGGSAGSGGTSGSVSGDSGSTVAATIGITLEFSVPDGVTAPAVGETWVVSTDKSDFSEAKLLAKGVIIEAGHIRLTFTARPPVGTTALYIARLDSSGTADATNVITINFGWR